MLLEMVLMPYRVAAVVQRNVAFHATLFSRQSQLLSRRASKIVEVGVACAPYIMCGSYLKSCVGRCQVEVSMLVMRLPEGAVLPDPSGAAPLIASSGLPAPPRHSSAGQPPVPGDHSLLYLEPLALLS